MLLGVARTEAPDGEVHPLGKAAGVTELGVTGLVSPLPLQVGAGTVPVGPGTGPAGAPVPRELERLQAGAVHPDPLLVPVSRPHPDHQRPGGVQALRFRYNGKYLNYFKMSFLLFK